ncbi:MAG: trigger factor [bacterium]|nr:trigger factor [bacterium]
MQLKRTNPSPTQTILTISANAEELAKAKNHALNKLAPQIKVAGFRQGKVPLNIVEKNISSNVLQSEILEEAVNKLYISAVRQENLRPVANPNVSIKKFVPYTELEFEADLATLGQIKLTDYKKIKLTAPKVSVEAKDVNEVIKNLQARAAERKAVKLAAKTGDEVVIDFKGTDSKNQPVSGADGNDYPLILGSNSFIPGFEDEITGLKSGETKTFPISFPKDYRVKALQSKKVNFEVTIKQINQLIEPKLDDNFVASVGPFKTVDELKTDIKKQLVLERQREADQLYENELLQKISDESVIEIPDSLIDEQIERIEAEEKQNLAYRGQTWEEHLKEEGVNEEEHKQQKRPVAEQRVKVGIILSEIAETEDLQATAQEIEVRLQMLKGQYRDSAAQAELDKPEVLRDIETRIRTEKTLQKLTSYAGAK